MIVHALVLVLDLSVIVLFDGIVIIDAGNNCPLVDVELIKFCQVPPAAVARLSTSVTSSSFTVAVMM